MTNFFRLSIKDSSDQKHSVSLTMSFTEGVQGISDLIAIQAGNLDFADVRAIMQETGTAVSRCLQR